MPLSVEAEDVLRAIFSVGQDRSLVHGRRLRFPTPGAAELFELCELLASQPREESLQLFLERHPGFLTSLIGTPDNTDLAVLFKPPIGTQYRADFCVLHASQGGAYAHMIEIESAHEPLFSQKGTPSQRLANAIHQTENWGRWINRNKVHYAHELVRHAQQVPLLGEEGNGRGFRLLDPEDLKNIWSQFGGFDDPSFSYTILMGRWSNLTNEEKERLMHRNRNGDPDLKVFTYEQLARHANFRLERDEWHPQAW